MNRVAIQPFVRTHLLTVVLGLAVTLSFDIAKPAVAELISFTVEGTVFYVDSPLADTFSIGDTFRLEYTFESLTPDLEPNTDRGVYFDAITDLTVTVGNYSATGPGSNSFSVYNSLFADLYRIDIDYPMLGPSVNGFDLDFQGPIMQLSDPTCTALTSDALPLSPPDPNDFISTATFLMLKFIQQPGDES